MKPIAAIIVFLFCSDFCSAQKTENFEQRERFMIKDLNIQFDLFSQSQLNPNQLYFNNSIDHYLFQTDFASQLHIEHKSSVRKQESHHSHLEFAPEILSEALLHAPKVQNSHFALHMEFTYEFQFGNMGIEPYLEFGYDDHAKHLGAGLQIGYSF